MSKGSIAYKQAQIRHSRKFAPQMRRQLRKRYPGLSARDAYRRARAELIQIFSDLAASSSVARESFLELARVANEIEK